MAKEEKKIVRFEDIDSSAMVNEVKAVRAFKGVFGGAKPNSAEVIAAAKLRAEGLEGEELVVAVYEKLGGLLDKARAKKNRENEKKEKSRKASK